LECFKNIQPPPKPQEPEIQNDLADLNYREMFSLMTDQLYQPQTLYNDITPAQYLNNLNANTNIFQFNFQGFNRDSSWK
jgi:hypothetical protein